MLGISGKKHFWKEIKNNIQTLLIEVTSKPTDRRKKRNKETDKLEKGELVKIKKAEKV